MTYIGKKMHLKNNIADYTESEFLSFIQEIFIENTAETDERLDPLLEHFETISGHPHGTDLIYYPSGEEEGTPEGIMNEIKKWRRSQGLPLFKDSE